MSRFASTLALGTVQWGLDYGIANRTGQPDADEVQRIAELGWRSGLRLLDTARAYGAAEAAVGAVLKRCPGWRVVTKLTPSLGGPGGEVTSAIQATVESLETSREYLGCAQLDVLLLHRPAHRTLHGGRIWEYLLSAKSAGALRQLGISATSPQEAMNAVSCDDIEVMQVASSLLDQRLERAGFFSMARETGTEVHLRSVFLQGVAFMDDALPAHLSALEEPLALIDAWSHARGASRHAAFLAYAIALGARQVILGVEKTWQLESHLRVLGEAEGLLPEIEGLARQIPDLPEEVVDPSRWPPR